MQIAKTIMIVDDDADDRNLFYEALMEVDPSCHFISAFNGEHALETLQSPCITLPDFIILRCPIRGGVKLDHVTMQRWVFKFTPLIETTFRKRKQQVGNSWRMNETYVKVKGEWMYQYRAVDKEGNTIDFLLTKRRNKYAAHKFWVKTINQNGCPKVINIDQSGANKEAIRTFGNRCFKKNQGTLMQILK
jgi:DDE domain